MVVSNGGDRSGRKQGTSKVVEKPACGRPRVEVSRHAQRRMKQRKISESELFNALNNPHETDLPTPAFRNRKRQCWHRSQRTAIHVVFELHEDRVGVITVIDAIRDDEDKPSKVLIRGKAKQRKPQRRGRRT